MISDELKFSNTYWGCNVSLHDGAQVDLQILSDENTIDIALIKIAEKLVESIDHKFKVSKNHALSSAYKKDIEFEGGLNSSALQIHDVSDIRFWFMLGRSNRQLAVSYKNGVFYDVYCESP